jgi:hypothetical protein
LLHLWKMSPWYRLMFTVARNPQVHWERWIEWISSISAQPTLTKLPILVERRKKPIRYDVVENETLDSEMRMES